MIMPKSIQNYFFAPCGINCMVCYVHLKKKKPCPGCLGSDTNKPDRCKMCKIKNCVEDKSISYCYECTDFPCKVIKNLEKSYTKRYQVSLIENSMYVKANGIEKFQKREKTKWVCKECGGVISLHDKICSECNKVK